MVWTLERDSSDTLQQKAKKCLELVGIQKSAYDINYALLWCFHPKKNAHSVLWFLKKLHLNTESISVIEGKYGDLYLTEDKLNERLWADFVDFFIDKN